MTMLNNWPLFILLLLGQVVFGVLTAWFLENIPGDRDLHLSLSFLGGILGLTLYCLVLVWFKLKPTSISLIPLVLFSLGVLVWRWKQIKSAFSLDVMCLGLFFTFILSIRMIFVADLLVPPYADSVQHVAIVRDMLSPGQPAQAFYRVAFDLSRYYHFGFHALAAWLGGVSAIAPIQVILILGQYFQALAVVGLYPLARIVLKDKLAAWLLMGLGGLFLPLPAYASNWGKYPAIASLVGVEVVLSLFFIYLQSRRTGQILPKRYYWLVIISMLTAFFLHSRTVVLFAIIFLLGLIFWHTRINQSFAALLDKNENKSELKIILAMIVSLLVTIEIMILDLPLHPLFGVFLLGVLLVSFYADFILTLFFASLMLTVSVFAIAPTALGQAFSLLDRPYVAIFIYIPLSFFLAIALNWLLNRKPHAGWRALLLGSVFLAGIFTTLFLQENRPNLCCVFMNDDDLFAFEWIRQNIPANALIGIAATGQLGNYLPADGGAWIEPMTGFSTRKLDSKMDFNLTSNELCQAGLEYVYVDDLDNSFDAYTLIESGAQHRLGLGSVSIYQLSCN